MEVKPWLKKIHAAKGSNYRVMKSKTSLIPSAGATSRSTASCSLTSDSEITLILPTYHTYLYTVSSTRLYVQNTEALRLRQPH